MAGTVGALGHSVGVGVQGSPVRLALPATPGQRYALPALYVLNTGSGPEVVQVSLQQLSRGAGFDILPSWIAVGPINAAIAPNASLRVPLELSVPAGAKAGRYLSDLVARASSPSPERGAGVGAVAAATEVVFTVTTPPPGGDLGLPRWPWWAWAAIGAALAACALGFTARRLGLRVRLERHR